MTYESYEIIVIGGGHAGAEAAWAAANVLRAEFDDSAGRRGRVALVTMDPARIGQMSCNPAIGGLAKGQMVREIDALGGLMAHAIDATGIQFRVLNQSKGPAVRGPRAQADKYAYAGEARRLLGTRSNLDIIPGAVERLHVEGQRIVGVQIENQQSEIKDYRANSVVLTTGTFMRGLMHTGDRKTAGGRVGEAPARGISADLKRLGFELGRLKTGTPPRLDMRTVDLSSLDEQPGDDPPEPFSHLTDTSRFPVLEQRVCWVTHTNAAIHDVIRANLDRAPMYNGQLTADCGPRYCPSIEDKVVRFADRNAHHVFLEPESLDTHELYCNGISTSLPADVQDEIVAGLPGCEHAKILRYGYAVEYDMVWPYQIDATTMTKRVAGLFLAGQINGTSGYEEAAGQGLLAGLNAVRHTRGEDLVRLGRDQAYIGVLMDDLVTRIPREPYRMFTSRAEHRLMLRADNAGARLTPLGRELALVDDARWTWFEQQRQARAALEDYCNRHKIDGKRMWDWLRRPDVDEHTVLARLNGDPLPAMARDPRVIATMLSDVKYAGFIERHRRDHERVAKLDRTPLPVDADYGRIQGLRNEARHALEQFRPATFGQASRLAGLTPADMTVLAIAFGKR